VSGWWLVGSGVVGLVVWVSGLVGSVLSGWLFGLVGAGWVRAGCRAGVVVRLAGWSGLGCRVVRSSGVAGVVVRVAGCSGVVLGWLSGVAGWSGLGCRVVRGCRAGRLGGCSGVGCRAVRVVGRVCAGRG